MINKHIDTSFRHFIKYKLNEITQSQQLDLESQDDEKEQDKESQAPEEESEIKDNKKTKKEHKVGSREYMAQMVREFENILNSYDNL